MFKRFFNYLIIVVIAVFIITSCNLERGSTPYEEDYNLSLPSDPTECHYNNDPLQIINNVFRDFEKGKRYRILRYLSYDIEWVVDGEEGVTPLAGIYNRKREVNVYLRNFFALIDVDKIVNVNTVIEENSITSYTRLQGFIPSSGKTIDMEYIFTWEFNHRKKINRCFITYSIYPMELACTAGGEGLIVSNTSYSAGAEGIFNYFMSIKHAWDLDTVTVEDIRAGDIPYPLSAMPTDALVEPVLINGIEGEVIRVPNAVDDKVIVYLHGGAFIAGDGSVWRLFLYELSKNTNIPVLSINFSLAPENPFPAGLNDCLGVYTELLNEYDAKDIALIGESSGGNLAITTTLLARDQNIPLPGAIIPLSPWIDLTNSSETWTTNEATEAMLLKGWLDRVTNYYVDTTSPNYPLVSPVHANVEGFPPVYLTASSWEVLLDDAVWMFKEFATAGVDVTIEIDDGMVHGWPVGVGLIPEATQINARLADFIVANLGVN
jgi:epsilon-lactone hydrolase